MGITYHDAGVNIAAGNEAIQRVKGALKSTFSKAVLTDIGSFGAGFRLGGKGK